MNIISTSAVDDLYLHIVLGCGHEHADRLHVADLKFAVRNVQDGNNFKLSLIQNES